MKKRTTRIILSLLLIFAVLQILPIERPVNLEVTQNDLITVEQPNEQVAILIKSACYDCHSNQTKHPWYSSIAPVSWWLDDHIEDARKHLNFSDWANYSAEKKAHKAEEGYEEVGEGEMPLWSYQIAHSEARLTKEEEKLLIDWFISLEKKYK